MAGRLIAEPMGGLANRLMALVSVMRLATIFGREFYVVWRPTSDCCGAFESLFDSTIPTISEEQVDDNCEFIQIGHGAQGWNSPPWMAPPSDSRDIWIRTHGIITVEGEPRGTFFQTEEQVAFELWKYLNLLRPHKNIQKAVDKLEVDGPNTFGLHVRRPYAATIQVGEAALANERRKFSLVSDEYYVELANRIIARDPTTKIFLACNDFESEEYLRNQLGSKAWAIKKSSVDNGNDERAVVEAFVDLLVLARLFGVVRFDGSHFAWMATLYRLIPNLIVRRNTPDEPIDLLLMRFVSNSKTDYQMVTSDEHLDQFATRRSNILRL